ncbi:MAG: DUF3343 domain-containing protein [Coriobacteriia bacterium]|nr:DUF3343 domain-containing protein [Coriobacteriia bacterium]MBN2822008.1 DUF3343 domain-containing protein [Coriobacteriia bacterium]
MSSPQRRPYVVFGFASTHDALSGEAALVAAGLQLTVMPTPKTLGALCGIALRLAEEDVSLAEETLTRAGVAWSGQVRILDR